MASSNAKSSALNLTSDFYMQNFYRSNRKAFKTSTRNDFHKTELSYEDTRALKRAISKLGSFSYSDTENGDNIVSSIQAFAKTYNNTIDSTSSEDSEVYRKNKQLKALTEKYGKDLKKIGITIEKDGKLSVSENVLKGASFDSVKKVFSKESDYMVKLTNLSRRMHNSTYEDVYEMMTGCGGRLNITL